ncbi:MAG: FAD-binding domain-containing protein [Bacteroidota bacterium]
MNTSFPTDYHAIMDRFRQIKPKEYCANRNYTDGDVTYLSPYISRGVISTKQILQYSLDAGYDLGQIEKFVQELAWRDYWQRVWQVKNIDESFKNEQEGVVHFEIPSAIQEGTTGIYAIDKSIKLFYETGYLHNHVRMYIASLATNVGGAHWKLPAKWMYYHLLDADWASNALSWQWVCAAYSNKKYYANQENINRFCKDDQLGTYLDKSYEDLPNAQIPEQLSFLSSFSLKTNLPRPSKIELKQKATALYTWYNLDPEWRKEEDLNRILILEPSHFEKYPISTKSMNFMIGLTKNIKDIQIYVGEFGELEKEFSSMKFIFKEHPTNRHFKGVEDQRDWLSTISGYYPSFFTFWKKVRKELI